MLLVEVARAAVPLAVVPEALPTGEEMEEHTEDDQDLLYANTHLEEKLLLGPHRRGPDVTRGALR